MNLLYCRSGVVLVWHDSAQAPVAVDAYGSGVRIIPYAGAIGSLERVGDPPADKIHDTRPYAQPAETPEILKAFASQVRYDTVTAGITWNSIPVKTDRVSQSLISSLAIYAKTLNATDMIDFTQDGVAYQIQADQVSDLDIAVSAFVQQCRSAEAQCLVDLASASPTLHTYEDVEARFTGLKSQTLAAQKKA